jgi:uncharacterized protein YndB with AHSA1/START domain
VIDIASQIGAIDREVRTTDTSAIVLLRRTYDAAVEDVWDALTDPDRLKRWFLPISGELRIGGTFQLEGNAGGEILSCEKPRLIRTTFGGPESIVELRLAPSGDERTVLELEHTVPIEMAGSGAGALYVGPGWDGGFLALALHVAGETVDDPVAMANSPEAQAFSKASVVAWIAVVRASGTTTEADLEPAIAVAMAQFAPDIQG